jgi:surfactin synthase thioesterase subunit
MHRTDRGVEALKLFCLPYAGGSASIYREWNTRLPAWIELVPLHMPGRGVRHGMPAMVDWPALLDLLLADAQPHIGGPFAIFGHSMGALVGIELAHALREGFGVAPVWFGASGCRAPRDREPEHHWLTCPEAEFVEQVRALKGMPEELLQNREFMDLVMPYLRADFHLCGTYAYHPRRPLDCPMLLLSGTRDDELARLPEGLSAWRDETRGTIEARELDADHFFINTHRTAVIDIVADSLARWVQPCGQSDPSLRRSYA